MSNEFGKLNNSVKMSPDFSLVIEHLFSSTGDYLIGQLVWNVDYIPHKVTGQTHVTATPFPALFVVLLHYQIRNTRTKLITMFVGQLNFAMCQNKLLLSIRILLPPVTLSHLLCF